MDKSQVASVLDEIAMLLELQGENSFRCNAYAKAGRAIAQLEENLAEVIAAGRLEQIPGIGATLRDKITELVTTGTLPFHEELKAKTPPGLVAMLRLPGIGPKKIKALYDFLKIDDLDKLQRACENGEVAALKGFGAKTAAKILEGITFLGQVGEKVRIDQALVVVEALVSGLKKCPGIQRLEVCGSLRRRKEVIKDVDLLASAADAGPVMEAFVGLPQVQRIVAKGETKSSVVVSVYAGHHPVVMNADLRVVTDSEFPFALAYFTGSKEHNVSLRQRAIQYGLKLNEYALAGPTKSVTCASEADIYKALDLDYIPPELREDTGEVAAAAESKLPILLEAKDLVGCFHNHTTWSDGKASLEEMANAARALGLKYLGIADHSQSLTIANGLNPARVKQQQAEMDALNKKLKGIHLFKGIECDILADGRLDFEDEVLDSFDYVVASVHSHFKQTEAEMTNRIIRAISHPRVTMLGHATGRLLLRREAYKVDLEAVLRAAAKHGTMIEINANPHRLDLDWIHCKRAKALGVMIVINPDAHSPGELSLTDFGVDVARRGWLTKENVFNTRSLQEVTKELESRRK